VHSQKMSIVEGEEEMKYMRFILKVHLKDFYKLRNPTLYGMTKFVREQAKNEDIYPEDIKMMRVNKEEKWVMFLIEREKKKSLIEVYNDSDVAKIVKEVGSA